MWHEYLKTHLHTFWQTKPSLLCVKMCSSTSQKGPRLPAMQALSIRSQEIVSDAWIFGASNVTISMVNRMGSQIQEISIESLSHFVLISCALNLDRWLDTNGLWLATLSWYRRCVLLIWLSLERKWNDIWCNCKFQDHKFWALALTEVWSVIMPSVDILYQSTFRVVTGNDASPNGQLWCKHWLTIHFTFKHTLFQKRNVNQLVTAVLQHQAFRAGGSYLRAMFNCWLRISFRKTWGTLPGPTIDWATVVWTKENESCSTQSLHVSSFQFSCSERKVQEMLGCILLSYIVPWFHQFPTRDVVGPKATSAWCNAWCVKRPDASTSAVDKKSWTSSSQSPQARMVDGTGEVNGESELDLRNFGCAALEFWGFVFWKYGRLGEIVEFTIQNLLECKYHRLGICIMPRGELPDQLPRFFSFLDLFIIYNIEFIPVTRFQGAMRVRCTARTGNGLQSGLDRSLRCWTFGKMVKDGSHESWGVTVAKSKLTKATLWSSQHFSHESSRCSGANVFFWWLKHAVEDSETWPEGANPNANVLKMMTSTIRMSWEKKYIEKSHQSPEVPF